MKDTPGRSRCRPAELSDADIIYDWNTVDERGRRFEQEILLLDETLRDGLQSPSITEPGIGDKIAIVHLLDELGVEYVNVGLPGAGPRAYEQVVELVRTIRDAKLTILPVCAARTHLDDIRPIVEISQQLGVAIECSTFTGSSPIRMYAEDWDIDVLVWNAICALEAGVDRAHGTVLGIGERVGNAALDQLLVNLKLLGELRDRDLSLLAVLCHTTAAACHLHVPPNYPIVGSDAFRTASGVHAAAIMKAERKGHAFLADRIYSSVPAAMLGREQEIAIGNMSGESNVLYWLRKQQIAVYPGHPASVNADECALAFCIPVATPGLKFICRDSVASSGNRFDHPLSSRFDEQDAFVIFDDVEVPRDRIHINCNLAVYRQVMRTPRWSRGWPRCGGRSRTRARTRS